MENTIAHIIGRAIINVVMMDVKTIAEAAKVILPEGEFDVKLVSDDTAELNVFFPLDNKNVKYYVTLQKPKNESYSYKPISIYC